MAEISPATEERIAAARTKRQSKACPLLIREDGVLYPNMPLVAKKSNFRPYHGDPKASLEDRMRYLQGLGAKRQVTYNPEPDEPFDIGAADLDSLMNFAQEQYGAVLDPAKPLKKLREEVYRLSQLPDPSLALPDPQAADVGTVGELEIPTQITSAPGRAPQGGKVQPAKPKAAGGLGLNG